MRNKAAQRQGILPYAWTPLSTNTRRCLTSHFPYGVIYQIAEEEIFVIVVRHPTREPGH